MELTLKKKNIGLYKKQTDGSVNQEATLEMIVPDSLPDVENVVDTDGTVVLRSKEGDNGKINVSGMVRAEVVYTPEGGGTVRGLNAQIPFTATLDAPEVTPDSRVLADVSLAGIEARLLNSRKLLLRADILVHGSAFGAGDLPIAADAEDEAVETERLEVLTNDAALNPVTDISEKAFTISENLILPGGKPPISAIVKSDVTLIHGESRAAGNKLIVKGAAHISVVYVPIGATELQSVDFVVPFSEFVDLRDGNDTDDKTFDVTLVPTGVYVQESAEELPQRVNVEIPAVAQAVVWQKINARYISDAYSTTCETNCDAQEHSVMCLDSEQTLRETFRETLTTSDSVRDIVCVRLYPGKIRRSADGFSSAIGVCVTFTDADGSCRCATGKFEADFAVPEAVAAQDASARMRLGETLAVPAAGGIEVRVPIDLDVKVFRTCKITPVSAVTLDETAEKTTSGQPSLVLVRVADGETLWSLAKRYNSTRALIRAANKLEETTEAGVGDMLIIARSTGKFVIRNAN